MRRLQVRNTLSTTLLATMLILSVMVSLSANVKPAVAQTVEWTRQFGDPQHFDSAIGVVADGSGAYTVGVTNGTLEGQTSSGRLDAFVRKYDPDGNVVWTRQFGTIRDDGAFGVSLDSTGVYVAGFTNGTLAGTSFGRVDGFVAKFDADGNDVWTREFGTENDDGFSGIAVDSSGIYLSGVWNSTGVFGTVDQSRSVPVVAKLDLAGNLLWTRELPAPEEAGRILQGISLDASGIYVAGSPVGVTDGAAFVTKLDLDGIVLWTRQFGSGLGFLGGFFGNMVAAGPSGVYAVNGTELRKYSGDGDLLWASRFSPPSPYPTPTTLAHAVSVDDSGVYLAGLTFSIGTFDVDVIVLKYDFEGNQIWTHEFGISENDYALAISADASGIYMAGITARFDQSNVDAFVAKLTKGPIAFDYSLSVNPTNTKVTRGETPVTTTTTVTATLTSGTAGPVTLSHTVTGPAGGAGVTATFSLNPVTPTGTSIITVTVQPSALIGTYTITVIGSPSGDTPSDEVATFTLRVNEVSQPPVLRVGDAWRYRYSGEEGEGIERVLRTEACGSLQCIVDQEVNSRYNSTIWITPDWYLVREYCVGCSGPGTIDSTFYTPPLQLYQFPLQVGKSWWWNTTATGWTLDSTGNHTYTFSLSVLRTVVNETIVTVPAGTFDTFLVAQYIQEGSVLRSYRWFSLQAETSVKGVVLDDTGGVANSYEMLLYCLDVGVDFSFNPTTPTAGLPVSFSAAGLGGCPPYSFSWNFGDGQIGTGQNPTHTYTTPGRYTVTVSLTHANDATVSATREVEVTTISVSISASPSTGVSPLTVSFASQVSGGQPPYTYSWNFGDGTSPSTQSNPSHTYSAAGSFTATLTVTDFKEVTAFDRVDVIVHPSPTVTIDVSTFSGSTPLNVNFEASGSGGLQPYSFSWNFGDGSPLATGVTATHQYASTGTFTAIVTITDAEGRTSQSSVTITVSGTVTQVATLGGASYELLITTNSAFSDFSWEEANRKVSFQVRGPDGTSGFANVTIPKALGATASYESLQIRVLVGGSDARAVRITEDATSYHVYFEYTHSEKTVTIEMTRQLSMWLLAAGAAVAVVAISSSVIYMVRLRKRAPTSASKAVPS